MLVLAAAFALVPAWLGWAWWKAGRRLETVRVEVAADLARRAAVGFDRPAILEPAESGDVVDAYAEARRILEWLREETRNLIGGIHGRPPDFGFPPAERLERSRAILVSAAKAVEKGLRRSRFRFDLDYRGGLQQGAGHGWEDLPRALVAAAELHRQAGEDVDALRAWVAFLALYFDDARGIETYWSTQVSAHPFLAVPLVDLLLSKHALSPEALAEAVRALDRVEPPSMGEACRLHLMLGRQDVLGGIRSDEAGARYLWSSRFLDGAILDALDREARAVESIWKRPVHERLDEAERLDGILQQELLGFRSWHGYGFYVQHENGGRAALGLIHTALAVAWQERETGHFPERLEELVPGRLKALPLDPATGRPFEWAGGKLRVLVGGEEFAIRIGRR